MVDKCCGICKYYEPERNPVTGRPMPSKPGLCTYQVRWPPLPQSYYVGSVVQYPCKGVVYRFSGLNCLVFERKKNSLQKEDGFNLEMQLL